MSGSSKETQRQTILHLWNIGVRNAKEIHARTNIALSTIYYNLKKLEKTGTVECVHLGGWPKKITGSTSRMIGQYIRRNTAISTRTLARKLSKNGVEVSYRTIGRHLGTLGYKKALPLATPMLTDKHKEKRVEWALAHMNDDWNRTLFTDETAFCLFRNTVERWYKHSRPTRALPKERKKISAWGGFYKGGKTDLFCFTQIMDSNFYVGILRDHLPEIRRKLGNRWRFQQDNDPKHKSRIAQEFLAENTPHVIDWPANSPDLNPIENLWCIVKDNVEKKMPQNLGELERFMQEEWQDIPRSTLIGLVGSMRRRCELVIEVNGDRISY